jgi:serine/threonine-protein kinase
MAATTARLPKKVASYEVKEMLGKGAMGEVMLAVHEHLDRPVALKRKHAVVDSGAISDKEAEERFLREAKMLARLKHHNIVAIHDFFPYRDNMYMVLEYVDGFTAGDLLKNGALAPDIAAIIALKIAEALEYAHYHRIIHRDIKPSNVMVSKDGEVKLMDFGIARDDNIDKNLTQTGMVVGTPMFLAPELLAGEIADERSDIYALGALLYQCLSGRRLFDHVSGEVIYPLILAGKYLKLAKVSEGVPRALVKIVDRCLSRKPDRRFATATELRLALERFLAMHYAIANHTARLLGYLRAKGKVGEPDASSWTDASKLVVSDTSLLPKKVFPWRSVAIVALLTALATALLFVRNMKWFDIP